MSALAAEQTCYDYNELIEIIYISWHHSSSRHTICGTWGYAPSKVDMSQDNIHVASHYALLRKGSYWPPLHKLLSDSAFSGTGPMAWNGLPVAMRLTSV